MCCAMQFTGLNLLRYISISFQYMWCSALNELSDLFFLIWILLHRAYAMWLFHALSISSFNSSLSSFVLCNIMFSYSSAFSLSLTTDFVSIFCNFANYHQTLWVRVCWLKYGSRPRYNDFNWCFFSVCVFSRLRCIKASFFHAHEFTTAFHMVEL